MKKIKWVTPLQSSSNFTAINHYSPLPMSQSSLVVWCVGVGVEPRAVSRWLKITVIGAVGTVFYLPHIRPWYTLHTRPNQQHPLFVWLGTGVSDTYTPRLKWPRCQTCLWNGLRSRWVGIIKSSSILWVEATLGAWLLLFVIILTYVYGEKTGHTGVRRAHDGQTSKTLYAHSQLHYGKPTKQSRWLLWE